MMEKMQKKTSQGTELWTDFDGDVWLCEAGEPDMEILIIQSELEEIIQFLIEVKANYEVMMMDKDNEARSRP